MDTTILWIIIYLLDGNLSVAHLDEHTPAACETARVAALKDMAWRGEKGRADCWADVGMVQYPDHDRNVIP